jgi:hypothetical protein
MVSVTVNFGPSYQPVQQVTGTINLKLLDSTPWHEQQQVTGQEFFHMVPGRLGWFVTFFIRSFWLPTKFLVAELDFTATPNFTLGLNLFIVRNEEYSNSSHQVCMFVQAFHHRSKQYNKYTELCSHDVDMMLNYLMVKGRVLVHPLTSEPSVLGS